MALLTPEAIALLERLPTEWGELAQLEVHAWDAPVRELERAGLLETRTWPPPSSSRRRMTRVGRALDDQVRRTTEVRRTLRGTDRLERIHAGRRRAS